MSKNKIYNDYIESNPSLSYFYTALPNEFHTKLKNPNFLSKYLCNKNGTSHHFNIVSGQQPGIFGGPLYTYYKIISLSKLSNQLQTKFNINVKPTFWIHSWDHDWEEVCSINFLTYDYQILPITYTPRDDEKGKVLYKISLNKQYLVSQVDRIFLNIKSSDFTDILKQEIINTIDNSSNLSEWSLLLFKYFFSYNPQISFLEPHKHLKTNILIEIISQAITNHPELYQQLSKTTNQLIKLNYKPQVHKSDKDAFFFLEEDGKRTKIIYEDNNFISTQTGYRWTKSELLNLLTNEPEKFTPNLILRCIYQQMLLNPIIYIAGPAEVAYWAQLKNIFEYFSLPMPIIYPRPRILLLPPKIKKWLTDLGINFPSDIHDENSFINIFGNISIPSPEINKISESIKEELQKNFISKLYNQLQNDFSSIPELEKIWNDSLNKIKNEIDKLFEKINRLLLTKNQELSKKITSITNVLFPNKTFQERFYSPISFFSEYGLEILKLIESKIDLENMSFQEIEL